MSEEASDPPDDAPHGGPRGRLRGLAIGVALGVCVGGALGVGVTRCVAPTLLPIDPVEEGGPVAARPTRPAPAPVPPPHLGPADDAPPAMEERAADRGDRRRATPPEPPAPPPAPTPLPDGIRREPDGTWVVSRAHVSDGRLTVEGASAQPHVVDGRTVGYRLSGVGGALSHLGLRSGDVMIEVNGQPLDSADHALEGYRRASGASRITLRVLRGGAPLALRYRIE